jgi:peptide deformylase
VYGHSNKGDKRDRSVPSVVGLAANQLGLPYRIIIVDLGIGRKKYNDLHVLVNPEITWSSKSLIRKDEGCVNLKYIRGMVPRSKRVKVSCLDRSGNKINFDLNGWAAVLLQHEVGHLNGELFIDHLDDPKKAHLVEDGDFLQYKKEKNEWNKLIDVSDLVKP